MGKRLGNLLLQQHNRFGILTKVMGIALFLVGLLGISVAWQVDRVATAVLRQDLERQGVSIARDVAARSTDLIFTDNRYALYQLVRDTLANNPDVRYIFLLDPTGKVLASTFPGYLPVGLRDLNQVRATERFHSLRLVTEEGFVHDIAVPVFDGRAGVVRVGMSETGLHASVAALIRRLWLITSLVSLVGILIAYGLAWLLTRPVRELVVAASAVGRGDLSRRVSERWAVNGRDELGRLSYTFNVMLDRLREATVAVRDKEIARQSLLRQVITAQEDERRRISRELHDQASQSLTSLLLGLRRLDMAEDQAEARAITAQLRELAEDTLADLHNLAVELRPPVLDDTGLEDALARYCRESARRWNLMVDFQAQGLSALRFTPEARSALYRILQEAVANVVKHAGATTVSVVLERQGADLVLIVEDDGRGFDQATVNDRLLAERKLGLVGMRERAALLGGRMLVETAPGAGTTIYVRLPLTEVTVGDGCKESDAG